MLTEAYVIELCKFHSDNPDFIRFHLFSRHDFDLTTILAAARKDQKTADCLANAQFENDWATFLRNGDITYNGVALIPQPGLPSFNLIFGVYLTNQNELEKAAKWGFFHALNVLIHANPTVNLEANLAALCQYHGTPGYVTRAFIAIREFDELLRKKDFVSAKQKLDQARNAFIKAAELYPSSTAAIHNAYLGKGLAASNNLGISTLDAAMELLRTRQDVLDQWKTYEYQSSIRPCRVTA